MRTATTEVLVGLCPDCGRLIHRIIRRADLEAIRTVLEVTVQKAEATIVGVSDPCVTVAQNKERRRHG